MAAVVNQNVMARHKTTKQYVYPIKVVLICLTWPGAYVGVRLAWLRIVETILKFKMVDML